MRTRSSINVAVVWNTPRTDVYVVRDLLFDLRLFVLHRPNRKADGTDADEQQGDGRDQAALLET